MFLRELPETTSFCAQYDRDAARERLGLDGLVASAIEADPPIGQLA
jgi:hypothetical protein